MLHEYLCVGRDVPEHRHVSCRGGRDERVSPDLEFHAIYPGTGPYHNSVGAGILREPVPWGMGKLKPVPTSGSGPGKVSPWRD
jgi:hypothetical protein